MPAGGIARVADIADTNDEDLVSAYQRGDPDAVEVLLTRYRGFTRLKARSYFLMGADREDIVQEGMIGLYKAIRDYSPNKQASFRSFAEVCITRQIITAIKTATRQKHTPLNSYVSLTKPFAAEDDSERMLMDILRAAEVCDPAELVIHNEDLQTIRLAFTELLSGFESDVLQLYVEGKSYHEIADHLGRHVKSIDNALQRIKRKLELHLRTREESSAVQAAVAQVAVAASPA